MKTPPYLTTKNIQTFIKSALEEDIQQGDFSSLSTIPKDLQQKAKLIVKEDCILAGVEMAKMIFNFYDKNLKVET
jgi:nicotinate-nucleotide pyrophosphorylase (carboxylating)